MTSDAGGPLDGTSQGSGSDGPTPWRVLLVEDNRADAMIIQRHLWALPARVEHVGSVAEAVETLERSSPDVILLDLNLPDSRGLEGLTRVLPHAGGIPVLVLTGVDSEAAGVLAVRNGAADYLVKDARTFRALRRVIRYAIERVALQRRAAHLDRLATAGRIAAGLAHELGNPAAFLAVNQHLMVELLEQMKRGEVGAVVGAATLLEMVRENQAGLGSMRALLSDLGRFARPDDIGTAEPLDLCELVRQVAKLTESSLAERVSLRLELDEVPDIFGDARRLHQVLTNLLINARDATPEGAPRAEILIRCRKLSDGVVLEIIDQGVGMTHEILEQAFEPFFTTKGPEGTGLGLSLSAEIVRQHGGTIDVESSPGNGATFRLRFPLGGPALEEEAPPQTILLVDDDESYLRALKRLLRTQNLVVTATAVADACRAIEEREFDLILADVMMPDGGGRALFEHLLRERPALLDRLVFVTGGGADPETRELIQGLPNRVLFKPITPELLHHLIVRKSTLPPPSSRTRLRAQVSTRPPLPRTGTSSTPPPR